MPRADSIRRGDLIQGNSTIRLNLRHVFVGVLCIGVICALIKCERDRQKRTQKAAMRRSAYHKLHTIRFGLLELLKDGNLPAARQATGDGQFVSWRVRVRQQIEDRLPEYRSWESWNSEHNLTCCGNEGGIFEASAANEKSAVASAQFLVVSGTKTAFPGTESISLSAIDDGLQNTILVVEVEDSRIHWMQPDDLRIEDLASESRSWTVNAGTYVLFADGVIGEWQKQIPTELLKSFLTIDGGEAHSRQWLLEHGYILQRSQPWEVIVSSN